MKSGRIHVFVALLLFEPCLAAWSPSQEARLVWLSADEIARGEEKAQTCFDQGKIPWSQAQESQRLAELPAHYKYWLTEDAGEIISPEERCAFLLLGDDQEREQFIEQFWIRRAPNPQSFENSFKVEHYRRIVEADRRFGANGPGWETDRGKYYIRYGTPDNQRLLDLGSLERKGPEDGQVDFHIGAQQPSVTKFKDLEAVIVTHIQRDGVRFSPRIEYLRATHASTVAKIKTKIPEDELTCPKNNTETECGFGIFGRISSPSGRVVFDFEMSGSVGEQGAAGRLIPTAESTAVLSPGHYQLVIAVKDISSGHVGVERTEIDVPSYEEIAAQRK